jgi:hypothetical protein
MIRTIKYPSDPMAQEADPAELVSANGITPRVGSRFKPDPNRNFKLESN